ncbi:transglycosylase SLT domain-containing protein [Iamia sp.]|uniref:transglycosylase SLT domain-containing protein n=1 Tax=Iamia sp. TaxID=2722710 RepID=UPI002C56B8AA|nr:transglycosylase SLT domain-containing protein [Iamia sp.]HXH57235.1 transglycosylase SLT domain-containing protein [Iamia sp.]
MTHPSTRRVRPNPPSTTTQSEAPPGRSRRRPLVALIALGTAAAALTVVVAVGPAPAIANRGATPPLAAPSAPVEARGTGGLRDHPVATQGSYTVRPGETLSGIALQHGTSVAALAAANGLADPDRVRHGTTLTIPAAGTATAGGVTADLPARLRESPARQAHIATFDRWAAANGVPADLLKAMTWLESGWQNDVVSSTGAVGIGQLMPDTVDFMELLIGADLDPDVVEDNIRMSARYLRWLLDRFSTTSDALAGYYQGPTSVERQGLLAETETYVADVLALRRRF